MEKFLSAIHTHVLDCFPQEACGLLTETAFIPCKNVAENPLNSFKIAETESLPHFGHITGIVHSHCRNRRTSPFDLRTPSPQDIENQKLSAVPWWIFATDGETILPAVKLPREYNEVLLERPFIWFINDCYSLVQDFYWKTFKIALPNHCSTDSVVSLFQKNDVFSPFIESYGFVYTNEKLPSKIGDILLLDVFNGVRNHLGVFTGDGVLHQDSISKIESLQHFVNRIHAVLRHKERL